MTMSLSSQVALFPTKSSNVRLSVSADPFMTSSPLAANKSSTLPGSPNHPRRSAMRWTLLQPPQRARTTPLSYDSLLNVFTDLVSQTPQVKNMARSCLVDVFRLDLADNFMLASASFSAELRTWAKLVVGRDSGSFAGSLAFSFPLQCDSFSV